MKNVQINPQIISWGLARAGMEPEALVKKFPKFRSWLDGDEYPTFKQLKDLAKRMHMPFGYFFLSRPPQEKLPIPFYRTNESDADVKPSVELIDTLYEMQRRVDWLSEHYRQNGYAKLEFIGSAKLSDPVEVVADKLRSVLEVDDDWAERHSSWTGALKHLFSCVEDAGIIIVANGVVGNNTSRKLNVSEFRGFVIADDYAPLIFVNNADAKAAQMFTVAHELAHLLYGSAAIFDLRRLQPASIEIERTCDKVAAEFLVPKSRLEAAYSNLRATDNPYQELARAFKVSEIVVARRLLDLGYIDRDSFFEFYNQRREESHERGSQASGGDFYNNLGLRVGSTFMRAVLQAVDQGSLTHVNAFRLTGLHGSTFDKYAEKVMGTL